MAAGRVLAGKDERRRRGGGGPGRWMACVSGGQRRSGPGGGGGPLSRTRWEEEVEFGCCPEAATGRRLRGWRVESGSGSASATPPQLCQEG